MEIKITQNNGSLIAEANGREAIVQCVDDVDFSTFCSKAKEAIDRLARNANRESKKVEANIQLGQLYEGVGEDRQKFVIQVNAIDRNMKKFSFIVVIGNIWWPGDDVTSEWEEDYADLACPWARNLKPLEKGEDGWFYEIVNDSGDLVKVLLQEDHKGNIKMTPVTIWRFEDEDDYCCGDCDGDCDRCEKAPTENVADSTDNQPQEFFVNELYRYGDQQAVVRITDATYDDSFDSWDYTYEVIWGELQYLSAVEPLGHVSCFSSDGSWHQDLRKLENVAAYRWLFEVQADGSKVYLVELNGDFAMYTDEPRAHKVKVRRHHNK